MYKFTSLLLAGCLLLSASGCTGQPANTLPPDVQPVVSSTPSASADVTTPDTPDAIIPSADTSSAEPSASTEPEAYVTPDAKQHAFDLISGWLSGVTGESWQEQPADPETGVSEFTAALNDGGVAAIRFINDEYINTEFRFSEPSDVIPENIAGDIAAYLGFELSEEQSSELQTCIDSVYSGHALEQVTSLTTDAIAYVFYEDGVLTIQID